MIATEEPRPPGAAYDSALRAELRRQVSIAGGVARVAPRVQGPGPVHENTLRGWLDVPFRVTAWSAFRLLVACGRPETAIVEVMGRACKAAGGTLARVHWGGAVLYGAVPEHELLLFDEADEAQRVAAEQPEEEKVSHEPQ